MARSACLCLFLCALACVGLAQASPRKLYQMSGGMMMMDNMAMAPMSGMSMSPAQAPSMPMGRKLQQMSTTSPMMMVSMSPPAKMGASSPKPAGMAPSMAPPMSMMKPMMYNLTLTPEMEVPATMNSMAMGKSVLNFFMDSIKYSINVTNLMNPTAAHIHIGAPGKNGPVVAVLYNTTANANMTKNGNLAMGTLMMGNLVGPAKGMTIMDFYNKYVATSMAYVNVHTIQYPDGIIRADITPAMMVKSS